jgi:hypothetical protein
MLTVLLVVVPLVVLVADLQATSEEAIQELRQPG